MKLNSLSASIVTATLLTLPALHAQETDKQVLGLQKSAGSFVEAYNNKDSAALAKLFTPDGEICGTTGGDLISGREQILAHYEDRFSGDQSPTIALEVDSVRLVASGLAIEDGIVHLTPSGAEGTPISSRYSAVLSRDDDGTWLIASTRVLRDVTDAAGQLADLARTLNGEWSSNKNSVRTDLAIGWHDSGKFLIGDFLVRTSNAAPQTGRMRIAWNPTKKSITSWTFDSSGSAIEALWTPIEDGWLIRSEGNTGDGEIMSANQKLTTDGANAFTWSATDRIIDGAQIPDNKARFVRRAPDPASN